MKKKLSIILAALLILAVFAGCAGAGNATDSTAMAGGDTLYARYADVEEAGYEYSSADNGQTFSISDTILNSNAKFIYTASMSLESTEFDKAAEALNGLVNELGGYFQDSSQSNHGTYRYASFTVRIAAENFSAFCNRAGEYCNRLSFNYSGEDVSESYYDLEARLKTQQTKLERLQALLAEAVNMEDIITIESAISETELSIESLTGSLRKYDSLIGYSTIYIYLDEVYKLSNVDEPAIGFSAKLAAAFKAGISNFTDGAQGLAISFAYHWIGYLIFILAAAVFVVLVIKRAKRTGKKQRYSKNAPESPGEKTEPPEK